MSDPDRSFEVLHAVRDLGLRQPAATELTGRVRAALDREIELANTGRNTARLHQRQTRLSFATWRPLQRIAALTPHVLTVVLVAITVVIAAGAILLLGQSRQARVAAAGSVATSRQQLLDTLGVLRRHPTAADRRLLACIKNATHRSFMQTMGCWPGLPPDILISQHRSLGPGLDRLIARAGNPRVDPSLARAIAIPRWDAMITLLPATWKASPRSSQRPEGIVATISFGAGNETGTGTIPTSVAALRAHGLALFAAAGSATEGVIIVPDGVAKVAIGPYKLLSGERPSYSLSGLKNVTAVVHDNLAAFQLNAPRVPSPDQYTTGPGGGAAIAQMTWFDAHGRVIAHTTADIEIYVIFCNRRGFCKMPHPG